MTISAEDVLRIILALAAGGAIGLEREFRDKAAGFRTLIFICVGAALFTLLSAKLAGNSDGTRIAANIVSGVGFLGAGVILREGGRVVGLTTAAAIWLTAALGMALGGGYYLIGGVVLAVSLVVLWLFPFLEHLVDNLRHERTYTVISDTCLEKIDRLEALITEQGLRIRSSQHVKTGDRMTCRWVTVGPPGAHDAVVRTFFENPDVIEFQF
ncbi:MAG TPA: MgtC/SapB family protein [Armatimonadota bacterium]|nr:MgtC/SapB family protein [Armatimonadota bacterium]HOS43163.1 MgtC/SapB family protein [Armatimonadota bacterium]